MTLDEIFPLEEGDSDCVHKWERRSDWTWYQGEGAVGRYFYWEECFVCRATRDET